jgi:uncharacterized protein YxjI
MKPRLIVEQKVTLLVNQYAIYEANADGQKGDLLAFAQQKRLAFKEKVSFYTDHHKSEVVFGFRAEKVLDIHGRYFVEDAKGARIGGFRKQFKKSLIKSAWKVTDEKNKDVFDAHESNLLLALIRRFGGFIPIVGNLIDLVIGFFRYHFVFVDDASGEEVGRYSKTTLFRDHYLLSMTDNAYEAQDWRVLAAMAVALDALQSR